MSRSTRFSIPFLLELRSDGLLQSVLVDEILFEVALGRPGSLESMITVRVTLMFFIDFRLLPQRIHHVPGRRHTSCHLQVLVPQQVCVVLEEALSFSHSSRQVVPFPPLFFGFGRVRLRWVLQDLLSLEDLTEARIDFSVLVAVACE